MKIYKVKPNKLDELKNWGRFLVENRETVKKLLKAENCSREFFYIFTIRDNQYVVVHMEGGPFNQPTDNEINLKHKQVLRECLEPGGIMLEELYDISVNKE